MLITKEELSKFSGVYRDEEDTLSEIFIGSATEIIENYVGYQVESYFKDKGEEIPQLFKLVCLEISSLIQMEESGNLGVNNNSEIGGISRNFLNVVNYQKYLERLSVYRKGDTVEVG